ncbi:MAG: hypothetical protein Q7J84_08515 [Sulfuricaulis sp.]|nr:hypothetical protein [Sulfuricaulis sp.]
MGAAQRYKKTAIYLENNMLDLVHHATHRLINQLPDEVSWDELAYQSEVRASIGRDLADADVGRLIPQEEIEQHFGITTMTKAPPLLAPKAAKIIIVNP